MSMQVQKDFSVENMNQWTAMISLEAPNMQCSEVINNFIKHKPVDIA